MVNRAKFVCLAFQMLLCNKLQLSEKREQGMHSVFHSHLKDSTQISCQWVGNREGEKKFKFIWVMMIDMLVYRCTQWCTRNELNSGKKWTQKVGIKLNNASCLFLKLEIFNRYIKNTKKPIQSDRILSMNTHRWNGGEMEN